MNKRAQLENGIIVLTEEEYDAAIIGTTEDGRVVYDYIRLVDAVAKVQNITDEEAGAWVEYNIIRGLRYMPADTRPVIIDMMEGYYVAQEGEEE